VDIEVVQALDGWPARQWEFGRRGHASAEQGGLREDDPDRWAPSVSDDGAVTGGMPITRGDGPGSVQSWTGRRENDTH
jgi:hypothetical protein